MKHIRIIALALVLVLGTIAAVGSSAQAHEPPPSSCDPADPPTCLYVPDSRYEIGVLDGVVLVDPDRDDYRVPLLIRYPIDAEGPRPVVIWNHGGNAGENGRNRSEEWGERLAHAGYVVIHPARVLPDDVTDLLPECTDNGFPDPTECAHWVAQALYGPRNVRFVIDRMEEIVAERPILRHRMDVSKIVVAGHSAGTPSVLATAGADRQWLEGGPVYADDEDPRPIAFLATGPFGPTYAGWRGGFDEQKSFLDIERPFLFVTGMGDETGEPIPTRLTAWLTSRPGNKALVWDTEPDAVHETMDIHKCDNPLREEHCAWIASVGVAYLDALVQHRPEAIEWMSSDALKLLSGGAIELHRR